MNTKILTALFLNVFEGRTGLWDLIWELNSFADLTPDERERISFSFVKFGIENGLIYLEEEVVEPLQTFRTLTPSDSLERILQTHYWSSPSKGQLTVVASLTNIGEELHHKVERDQKVATDLFEQIIAT